MYIVIVGCSEAGYHLTKVLLASAHEVVVVDKDRERCRLLSDDSGVVTVRGDGATERTLQQAGVARADIVIATTDRDETNLVICQLSKGIFQVPRTMALIKDPKNEPIFHVVGVDVVVNAIHLILSSFEEGIPGRPLIHLMNLRVPDTELISVSLPEDASVVESGWETSSCRPTHSCPWWSRKAAPRCPTTAWCWKRTTNWWP